MIGEDDRPLVLGKPFHEALLVRPMKAARRVLGEVDIIRRVSVDEITRLRSQVREVSQGELPGREQGRELGEVAPIVDDLIPSEGDVEVALLVEAAEPVEASTVEVVEELCGFGRLGLLLRDELVEAGAVLVIDLSGVRGLDLDGEALLYLEVKVDQVRVAVIEQGLLWSQAERDRETACEGLHQAAGLGLFPEGLQVREEPALAACPLQGWARGRGL